MRFTFLLVLLIVGLAGTARAQEAYCYSTITVDVTFLKLVNECPPGDIIIIPADRTANVAMLCDFTKQIVSLDARIMCVRVARPRPARDVK